MVGGLTVTFDLLAEVTQAVIKPEHTWSGLINPGVSAFPWYFIIAV